MLGSRLLVDANRKCFVRWSLTASDPEPTSRLGCDKPGSARSGSATTACLIFRQRAHGQGGL